MWQAENPELARDFPAGTASKARQSRLHQAQGFFRFLSFIRSISEHFARLVSKNKNFSPLMPINCLINCPINSVQFVNNSCSKNKLMAFDESIHGH